ncbi:hypothetical protein ACGFJT_36585 [Actinomadura geliboluensis]|uniref:hypothetical protein n=1 Tax=Actinomadura geliboluensis TaxID=882440 RepID=UPI003717A83F
MAHDSRGSHGGPIRIGTVIMHHPRRAERLRALTASFGELRPRIVRDPDPDAAPSPLRTAKRAWAAIDDDSTHHLVLQDDVVPAPGFARHLHEVVAAHPDHGIAMYSHWNSPHNSYLSRRGAVAGTACVPLSATEWTPTQGLVLPVAAARRLAAHLAGVPDEAQDDDEQVVVFCRREGVPVVATVPHLLDHGHDPTIVGHHGRLHSTVFAPRAAVPDGHWSIAGRLEPGPYAVELLDSRCGVRLMDREPVEHKFGWYWYDACALTGRDPEAVLAEAAPRMGRLPGRLVRPATEVWAAGFLLGADVASAGAPPPGGGPLTRTAVETWVDSGLSEDDHAMAGRAGRTALADLGVAAVRAGLVAARGGLAAIGGRHAG